MNDTTQVTVETVDIKKKSQGQVDESIKIDCVFCSNSVQVDRKNELVNHNCRGMSRRSNWKDVEFDKIVFKLVVDSTTTVRGLTKDVLFGEYVYEWKGCRVKNILVGGMRICKKNTIALALPKELCGYVTKWENTIFEELYPVDCVGCCHWGDFKRVHEILLQIGKLLNYSHSNNIVLGYDFNLDSIVFDENNNVKIRLINSIREILDEGNDEEKNSEKLYQTDIRNFGVIAYYMFFREKLRFDEVGNPHFPTISSEKFQMMYSFVVDDIIKPCLLINDSTMKTGFLAEVIEKIERNEKFLLGVEKLDERKYEEAQKFLEGSDPTFLSKRSFALMKLGKYVDALKHLKLSIEKQEQEGTSHHAYVARFTRAKVFFHLAEEVEGKNDGRQEYYLKEAEKDLEKIRETKLNRSDPLFDEFRFESINFLRNLRKQLRKREESSEGINEKN